MKFLGVYRGKKRVGYEALFGKKAKGLSPFKDCVLVRQHMIRAKKKKDFSLLFLNLRVHTLLFYFGEVKEAIKDAEGICLPVIEVSADEVFEHREQFKKVREKILLLSVDHFTLSTKHINLLKDLFPAYVKLNIKNVKCLGKEGIEAVCFLLKETMGAEVVLTHVETEEEFRSVPEGIMWMGFYETTLCEWEDQGW